MWLACILAALFGATAGQTITPLAEHVLYEDLEQEARSTHYYSTVVTRDFYAPGKQLVFRVVADRFGSDPDIFISRTEQYPNSPETASWYCVKKGSETCIVADGDFAVSDTLYFGVFCLRDCSYKLKIWYAEVADLLESERQQIRFEAYSTYIMQLYIPEYVTGLPTTSLEIRLESEAQYSAMGLWLSLDNHFQIIEERVAEHVDDTAIGLKFSRLDYAWCTDCTVYAIFTVEQEDRYYVSAQPRTYNADGTSKVLQSGLPVTVYVSPFQQDCYRYFVERTQATFRIDTEAYAGEADLYISSRDLPSGPSSDSIEMRAAQGPVRSMTLTSDDRAALDAQTGAYYVCFYAYTEFSAQIMVEELLILDNEQQYNFEITDGVIITQPMLQDVVSFNAFHDSGMVDPGNLTVYVEFQGLDGEDVPEVYWKMCQAAPADCKYKNEDVTFASLGGDAFEVLPGKNIDEEGNLPLDEVFPIKVLSNEVGERSRTIVIEHVPSLCLRIDDCSHMFTVWNTVEGQVLIMSLRVTSEFNDPGNIFLSRSYVNSLTMGSYFNYELTPASNSDTMPWLSELTIQLRATRGDGDLFASLTEQAPTAANAEYQSRKEAPFDQLVIQPIIGRNVFDEPIYFSVFARTYVQYEITFRYKFTPDYNELLADADTLAEGVATFEALPDEYDERLYSFVPWWSGQENRTAVFLADVLANNVFFYSDWNEYPKHYGEAIHDANDVIPLYGSADAGGHQNGTYYIRLRPEFALADLLSMRQYVYNMFAFSMAPASLNSQTDSFSYDTLELGVAATGHIDPGLYQDYRYFVMDQQADFDITLRRIPGRGQPVFYVNYIGSTGRGAARANRYDQASSPVDGQFHTQRVYATRAIRDDSNWRCGTVYHSQQADGSQECFIAISVTCLEFDETCDYQLTIDLVEIVDNNYQVVTFGNIEESDAEDEDFVPPPPGPIITQGFTNGRLDEVDQVKYYFFPIDYENRGLPMILLNKTKMSGQETNGDTLMIANLQPNIYTERQDRYDYTNWNYPTLTNFLWGSYTGNVDAPEILEACLEGMDEVCEDANGCALIVGVIKVGTEEDSSDEQASDYRLRGFFGEDRLTLDEPVFVEAEAYVENQSERWTYHWYIITDEVGHFDHRYPDESPNDNFDEDWAYFISVAPENGQGDPDLYVSLYDGRYPSANDWDVASKMNGADAVVISSRDSIWVEKGWDTSAGVVVVVGVHETEPTSYSVILTQKPPITSALYNISPLALRQVTAGNSPYPEMENSRQIDDRGLSEYFMYYNWGGRNFEVTLSMVRGDGTLSIGATGQLHPGNNLFSAVPYNTDYAQDSVVVDQYSEESILITASECYSCWYIIRVDLHSPEETEYRVQAAEYFNIDNAWVPLTLGQRQEQFIRGRDTKRGRFSLDNMENWSLEAEVSSGDVTIYVGLNEDDLYDLADGDDPNKYLWSTSGSAGETAVIRVRQTDPDFHLGAVYFIFMVSSSPANVIVNLELKQALVVNYLGNNNDYTYSLPHAFFNYLSIQQKFTYATTQEQVKYHAFQAPAGTFATPTYHRVTVRIAGLTPHLYPMVYVRMVSSEDNLLASLEQLAYPSRVDHQLAFGENPFGHLGQSEQFYEFFGKADEDYIYYTMAVYQENWGLTDDLKSEYEIFINVSEVTRAEAGDDYISRTSGAVNSPRVGTSNTPTARSSPAEPTAPVSISNTFESDSNGDGWFISG